MKFKKHILKGRGISFAIISMMILQLISVPVRGEASEREYIAPFNEGKAPKIFLASDSTCEDLPDNWYPREGWGMEIGNFFKDGVTIVNKAKGGKSTRSFLTNWDAPSGVYDTRMDDIKRESSKGDWLFVQFGHNDFNNGRDGVQTDAVKTEDGGDYTSYRKNLERFIEFADENNLNIAFLTPIHMLTSFSDGKLTSDGLDSYRQAMQEVGEEHGVPVLLVGEEHKQLIESLGEGHAKDIFMFVSRDDYPDLPSDVSTSDTTHINQAGAIEVSKIIINQIKKGAESGIDSLSMLYSFVDTNVDTSPMTPPEDENPEPQPSEEPEETVSMTPGKNNAYILFGENIETNHMTFIDGLEQGITSPSDPLYSEEVELDGIKARRMYAANVAYMNLDRDYFEPGDHRFLVQITYYDFGPDVGYFYFDYNSNDESLSEEDRAKKRITITKPGITPKWSTIRLYINDADFSGAQEYGADMSLVTRTYNAWGKIEIINVDALERNQSGYDLPVANAVQADCLEQLGLYHSEDNALEDTLNRIECLKAVITALGYESEIGTQSPTASFSDLSGEDAKVVALGEKLGIVDKTEDGIFNPEQVQTVNEALAYFLKYLKVESENDYTDAYELAEAKYLIKNTDFIIFKDNPVSRDNFVAMAYNALMAENEETGRAIIGELMSRGIIETEELEKTGIPELAAYQYYNPVKIPKESITDKQSGRTYYYMNFDGAMALKPYVSSHNWNYEGDKFIFGCRQTNAMYEYDIVNETVRFLDHAQCDGVHLYATVLPNNMIYYCKDGNLWKMNWETGEKEFVVNRSFSILSVTNDETYASGDYAGSNARGAIGRVNLKTGEFEEMFKDFKAENPNSQGVNHSQINPGYPELNFFCNEGETTLIPDRLWLLNWDTGEMYNMFKQAVREDGLTGENSGHEVWGMDGEYMYWVKFLNNQTIGQTGLMRSDKYGNTREYINGDYSYWHCYPSGDDNWIVGDTSGGQIILVNANSYQSQLLAQIRMYNWNHPYQPHPCVSRNAASVNWQMVNDDNLLGIGWMDISDLTSNNVDPEYLKINDQLTAITYEGTDCYAQKGEYNNEECIIVPKKSKLCCDIDDDFLYTEDGKVQLEITYLDFGILPITINYTGAIKDEHDLANCSDLTQAPTKTGTGTWKTITVELPEANLANGGEHKSDFIMYSLFSQLIIKDIKIIKMEE